MYGTHRAASHEVHHLDESVLELEGTVLLLSF